ncbi:MAG: nucleotidyltransferase domain-containing protein [Bdellovibrionota bacterium]
MTQLSDNYSLKFGLTNETILTIHQFFKKFFQVQSVKIYGSRAMGNYSEGSDIDLAVFGDCESILTQLQSEIEELPTPYKFDVLNYNSIENKNLKEHIDRVGKLFYEKF